MTNISREAVERIHQLIQPHKYQPAHQCQEIHDMIRALQARVEELEEALEAVTDISREAVERFDMAYKGGLGIAEMLAVPNGNYVRYSEYATLLARVEEQEAENAVLKKAAAEYFFTPEFERGRLQGLDEAVLAAKAQLLVQWMDPKSKEVETANLMKSAIIKAIEAIKEQSQ